MRVRDLSHGDVSEVVEMLRSSFPAALSRYFTRAQRGAEALYHAMLDNSSLLPSTTLLVAVDEHDRPAGFAELGETAGGAHLSYICTAARARRTGVATALIGAFIQRRQPPAITLDVFADNDPAIQMYQRLGFEVQHESWWLTRHLPPASEPARVGNPYEAMAMRTLFGFCSIDVSWAQRSAHVGLLGEGVIRCFDASDFADDGLLAAVRATSPSATEAMVVATSPRVDLPGQTAEILVHSLRMTRAGTQEPAR